MKTVILSLKHMHMHMPHTHTHTQENRYGTCILPNFVGLVLERNGFDVMLISAYNIKCLIRLLSQTRQGISCQCQRQCHSICGHF
jgi:hypothetical protein